MKEMIEQLTELTINDEIKWDSYFPDGDFGYAASCEKLNNFNISLYVNRRNGYLILDILKHSKYHKYFSCQNELCNLWREIESKTEKIEEIKLWLDNYDKLVIEKTNHTWKLPE